MNDFKSRLEQEQEELKTKCEKLYDFIESENFDKIDEIQKRLLRAQINAMQTYYGILLSRLKYLQD